MLKNGSIHLRDVKPRADVFALCSLLVQPSLPLSAQRVLSQLNYRSVSIYVKVLYEEIKHYVSVQTPFTRTA